VNLKINASNLVTRHYLEISDRGVEYCETVSVGGVRRFRFDQIAAILRGVNSVLSFQVGHEIFKIPIQADNAMHRAAVARFVSEVRRTVQRTGA